MKKYVILFVLLITTHMCNAVERETKPVPWKAATLSFVLPGGGQVYNKSYYRAGLFFAAEAAFLGMSVYHHNEMKDFEGKRNSAGEDLDLYALHDEDYEFHYRRRNSYYWWLGISIVASITDAYVDASLWDFEAKKSKIHLEMGERNIGLSLRF